MLQILRTEDTTGVFIMGSYEDLYTLREAISNIIGDKTDYDGYEYVNAVIQNFCYELIHAYRGERESYMTNSETPNYKFPMLLPEMIFIANALNDYIILSETKEFYVDKSVSMSDSLRENIRNKIYIDKAYIKFFQSTIWYAVKDIIGEEKFEEIKNLYDYRYIYENKDLKYKDYCKDWIDILNIRYINCESSKNIYLIEVIKKLSTKDDEYHSKEKAMKEHAKDGNISLYLNLLAELSYPDEWDW